MSLIPTPIEESGLPWLWERARREPGKPALGFGAVAYSFDELAARAQQAARRLVTLGIRAGDRVALIMDASARMIELIHAAQRLGAVLAPLNTRLTAHEIAALADAVEPRALIYDREHLASLQRLSGRIMLVESEHEFDSIAPADLPAMRSVELNDVHTILFTSGTTGTPRGAMLTNGNHFASARASRANLGVHPNDRWLDAMPLYHVGGLSTILRSVIDGVPVILHRGFDPAAVNLAVRDEGVTLLSVVATMLTRMLDHNGERPYPSSLRAVLTGGGPVPDALVQRARRLGIPVVPTYGLTETASQVASASLEGAIFKAGSCGRPLAGTQVKIERADSSGRGEIAVKGPTVMAGYYRQPEATAGLLRDGWLFTGDIGRLDDDGSLYIDDRRIDLIVSGGENVYPAEVEAALTSHPMIAEAAVYAIDDSQWGHRVAAAVVLRDESKTNASELRAWCESRLARFKIPRSITFMSALPRTPSGKIKRVLLRERHQGAADE